jgi:transposase-like protein
MVSQIQIEFAGPSPNDGAAWNRVDAHNDFALGAALCAGVQEALEHVLRSVGGSWRCDETYIKVKGRWTYLYRAVDKLGRTVDFLMSQRRDVAAAKRFFSKAIKKHGTPRVITLDAYAASHRAVTELKSMGTIARPVLG